VVLSLAYFGIVLRSLLEMRRGTVPAVPVTALVGTDGKAETTLAPTGVAYAGGESWSARSRSGVIPAGTPVRIVAIEGLQLIVEPAEQPSAVTLTEGTTHG
jgi:membrane-bound ClpP family serine protease